MLIVQKDVYSGLLKFLADKVVQAYDRRKTAGMGDAVDLLRSWNGQMEKSDAAPMLIRLVYDQVRNRVAESASPGKSDLYSIQIAPSVVQLILEANSQGWFANQDEMLTKSLTDAIEQGRKLQGGNVKRWNYGEFNKLTILQPVVSHVPVVGAWFNIGPAPMSGSSTTVKQTTQRMGPSMRFVADLSDWDNSLNNITVGASGEVLSRHYKDQWEAYYSGQSFPMRFRKIDAKATLTVNP
jgi:penicillin amidase